eukprot:TRINITY_DN2381_c0_g6_i1.p1 TRINITY_DN2381_c0_g6~~TRINITY_DN2381_c0_g6_i1.p1  ORF type:complete len:346 (-),score=66.44 TRINITY_DN2381_c0_g6_i1:351-1388(-)
MSGDVAAYLRESHKEILSKMMNTLIKKEVGEDYELMAGIAGLICASIEDLKSIDKQAAAEILRIFHTILTATSPPDTFFTTIDASLKAFSEEQDEAKVEEIRKQMSQAAAVWVSEANANGIVLEVLAELFTSEEITEEESEEDMKMEEETSYVETMADSLLNEELISAIIKRCTAFITNDKYLQLKSLRETSSVCKAAEKLRKNAFSCLLNLVLNRPKKVASNTNLKGLILNSLKEIVGNTSETKATYLREHISTFVKVSFERLNTELHLESSITQPDLSIILASIQTTSEKVQENVITVLGVLLKSMPHSLDFNKASLYHNCRNAVQRYCSWQCKGRWDCQRRW